MDKKLFTLALASTALLSSAAVAETITTETYTGQIVQEDVKEIPFSAFDVNNDGLYAKSEVGEKLFYVFDRDGNETIDNNEWEMRSVRTIIPMEQEVYRFVDYDDDGYTDLSSYDYETFFAESGLVRFDENRDGLTPREFIGISFQEIDDNDNNIIELDEWEGAYIISFKPEAADQDNYN